ncbi:hypothetical protein N7582_001750 [Saccharomyces uvarum]|uniref:Uncharacterized protein n=1 Tax=Saccharomyces uvarum TaxID=230603 RepID=A0AA35NS99_SACUV|nr:hypothetical protein N7582_001750 [Saccharomyces uvarum]CAI4060914.1 hypothetical protein SUVC_06G0760 [Saccharomyces uvarum]
MAITSFITILTVLLAVTTNALQSNHSCEALADECLDVALPPPSHISIEGNATGKQLMQGVGSGEPPAEDFSLDRQIAEFFAPCNGSISTVGKFNFSGLEKAEVANMLKAFIDNYYEPSENSACRDDSSEERLLGSLLDTMVRNNSSVESLPAEQTYVENAHSYSSYYWNRSLNFTIFKIPLYVSFNIHSNYSVE